MRRVSRLKRCHFEKRSNSVQSARKHSKIEQRRNGTFPKELFHSFSSVSRGCDRLDLSHDRAHSVIGGMSQESDSGNPVEGICSDTFFFFFLLPLRDLLSKKSNLCVFTCDTCVLRFY